MKKLEPVEGLVVRYDYLWKDEYQRGRSEGQKERPCAIVIAAPDQAGTVKHVIVAPITHSTPRSAGDAIEIPLAVKKHLGLDDERSWIVVTEVNRVNWNDPGIVPAKRTDWVYGAMPQGYVKQVQDRIRDRAKERRLDLLDRDRIAATKRD